MKARLEILACLLLSAGVEAGYFVNSEYKVVNMIAPVDVKSRLEFTCKYERIPEATPDAQLLFQYGQWLQRNNQLKRDAGIYAEVGRLYRIAAEHHHYHANIALQKGGVRGLFDLTDDEYLRFSQGLIEVGVASGYYFVGIYLQRGFAGLHADHEMALRYIRKAADEGNAAAQFYIADKLEPVGIAPEVAKQMQRCASEQGHGKAAGMMAVGLQDQGQYEEAIKYFQLGVAAGDETSAAFLDDGFRGPSQTDELNYLGQQEDLERATRYNKIWRILANYSYANPKVPEINDIVPLPPAPLPEWNGKLQWLEERLANIPPETPSEALIKRLADEKKLDPATGLPMPGAAGFSMANYPVKVCLSGELCPQTGYWKAMWLPHESRNMRDAEVIRHLKEGEVMPTHWVERNPIRYWPLSDKRTVVEENVRWGLLG